MEEQRKNHHRRDLADQSTDKGNDRGDQTVIQRREQRASENIKTAQQERQGVDRKSANCHFHKGLVVAYENRSQRAGQQDAGNRHEHRGCRDNDRAFFEQAFQFAVVLGTVIESDQRCGADGEADKHRQEEQIHIHNDAVGGDAILAGIL